MTHLVQNLCLHDASYCVFIRHFTHNELYQDSSLSNQCLCTGICLRTMPYLRGVYSDTTELNWTQLTQLNSVQPSQSCFCLWCHDLQTESTAVHAVELSSVEFSWVELSCVAINGPLIKTSEYVNGNLIGPRTRHSWSVPVSHGSYLHYSSCHSKVSHWKTTKKPRRRSK